MKRILIIAIAALALTGCQEKKNAAAVSQTDVRIDSLQRIIDQKDNELNDVISTFNEIQEGFRLIELAEKNVSIIKDGEATNKPEQIRESIRSIQQRMQHNRELIARLQQQVREGSSRSEELRRTINNFVKELEAKNNELQQLRTELQEKDIRIAELDNTVSTLNSDVTELREETAKKTETINNHDYQLNNPFYFLFTNK